MFCADSPVSALESVDVPAQTGNGTGGISPVIPEFMNWAVGEPDDDNDQVIRFKKKYFPGKRSPG